MATTKYSEAEFLIPGDRLLAHAIVGTAKNAAVNPDLARWSDGTLNRKPLIIYDINGQPLFYDFRIGRGDATFGYVRVAASRLLGSSVIASEMGERKWSFESAARKLSPKVKKEFAGAKVSAPRLVCYSYPKLGVQFDIDGPAGKQRAIFDVASLARVPEKGEDQSEGFVAWSFYDALSDDERKRRLARFKKVEGDVTGLTTRMSKAVLAARTVGAAVAVLNPVFRFRRTVTKLLQYCTHYGHTHARSHHCFVLHGQQVNDYCAVATCQMILCYYRYYYSQNDIAPALGYNAGGGCPPDQSPGYRSLTCNHLDSSFDA